MLRNSLFYLVLFCFSTSNSLAQKVKLFVNGKEIELNFNKELQILAKQKTLNVKITSPESYSYKLEKHDTEWIICSQNTTFNYDNLAGGEYYILIKDNLTQKQISNIKLKVEMPFWRSWSFIIFVYLSLFLIATLIIFFFFQYRFRQQTKLQRVRDNIASDLHDDVGATLSSISFFGEMMRSKINKNAPKEEVLPLLDKLITTSKETVETMRGVVWTINPNNDNAVDFFGKLQSFGKEILSAKGIEFSFESSGFENQKLPLEVQRNLFLFYKEAINNTAKHSKASKVGVDLRFTNDELRININDDGFGFNPADLHEGHGLKSLRKRAAELEGTLTIDSVEGKGTRIELKFPAP